MFRILLFSTVSGAVSLLAAPGATALDDGRVHFLSFVQDTSRINAFLNGADRNAVDHIERMLSLYPGLWQSIREVFLRHDDLSALTYGDAPRATSDTFGRVLDLAAARDLPVLVHSNIGSAWLEQPNYPGEIEHPGISRQIAIPYHTENLRRMLRQYFDRFVIGSDAVALYDQYKATLQRYYLLRDALKPETAKKVAQDNFLNLLPSRSGAAN